MKSLLLFFVITCIVNSASAALDKNDPRGQIVRDTEVIKFLQAQASDRKVINKHVAPNKTNKALGDNPSSSDGVHYTISNPVNSSPSVGKRNCPVTKKCQAGWTPIVDSDGCSHACQPQKGGPEPGDQLGLLPPSKPPSRPAVCQTISMICNDGETPIADKNGCVMECSKGKADLGEPLVPNTTTGGVCPLIAPVCAAGTHPVPNSSGCFLSCEPKEKAIDICRKQINHCGDGTAIRDSNTQCILACERRKPASIDNSGTSPVKSEGFESGSSSGGVR